MGKEGRINLEGTVGYAFEAEGKVTGCVSGPPAYNVSTTIKDGWPSAHIRLTKPDVCSVEVCFLVFRKPNEYDRSHGNSIKNSIRY